MTFLGPFDPNKIRLNPINPNQILLFGSPNSIWLLKDPIVPPGWEPNPGSTVVGGGDSEKGVGGGGGVFGSPDEPSGNQ